MAPKVDIRLGTSLVQVYDGTPENLNSFLDAVSLFTDNVNADFAEATPDQKAAADQILFKFVKARLTSNARQAINGAQTVQDLITTLRAQCASKVNSDNMLAKLKSLKQKDSLESFCDQVEQLTLRLATTYMEETIPADKANQIATKAGVQTLINGITNSDTKLILKAGTFAKITEATQKIHECDNGEKNKTPQAQVFMAHGRYAQQGRGRGRNYGNRGYHNSSNRGRFNNQSRFSDHRNNQQNNRYSNHRGQGNRGRGRYGPPNYYPQQQQQATYFAQAQPQPCMQPHMQPVNVPNQPTQPQAVSSNFLGAQFGQRTQ